MPNGFRERVGAQELPSALEVLVGLMSSDEAARRLFQEFHNKVCENYRTEYENTLPFITECWIVYGPEGVPQGIECISSPNPRRQEIIREALRFGCLWPTKVQRKITELYEKLE